MLVPMCIWKLVSLMCCTRVLRALTDRRTSQCTGHTTHTSKTYSSRAILSIYILVSPSPYWNPARAWYLRGRWPQSSAPCPTHRTTSRPSSCTAGPNHVQSEGQLHGPLQTWLPRQRANQREDVGGNKTCFFKDCFVDAVKESSVHWQLKVIRRWPRPQVQWRSRTIGVRTIWFSYFF